MAQDKLLPLLEIPRQPASASLQVGKVLTRCCFCAWAFKFEDVDCFEGSSNLDRSCLDLSFHEVSSKQFTRVKCSLTNLEIKFDADRISIEE